MNKRIGSVCLGVVMVFLVVRCAAGEDEGGCTVSLVNGDRMAVQGMRIAAGRAVFHPSVAPDAEMKLPVKNISMMAFGGGLTKADEKPMDSLRLRDGTFLQGTFVKLTAATVEFDFENAGRVVIPREAVSEIVRSGANPGGAPRADRTPVLVSAMGDVLYGDVNQAEDGTFAVSGGAVEARLVWASIDAIAFPDPPGAPQAEETGDTEVLPSEKMRLVCSVSTRRGSMVVGTDAELTETTFSLVLAGGQRVSVPVGVLHEVSFSEMGTSALSTRVLLVWGTWADRGDEYNKTMTLVRAGLGDRWTYIEDFSRIDDAFQKGIVRAGVLLIPEWEQGSPEGDIAEKFKPIAESFLRRGGKIIMLGPTGNHVAFMHSAGLMNLSAPNNRSDGESSLTPEGRAIFKNAKGSFPLTNSTQFYAINEGKDTVPLAGTRSDAPIVGRRVGRGWVIVMGMDYYAHNEKTEKMLIEAITLR